jgi:hypothetical protein
LALFDDVAAVCGYEITCVASKRINPGLGLGWKHVNVQLIRWSWENGHVIQPLFPVEVVKRSLDALRGGKIERRIFSRWIEFRNREFLQSCALGSFVDHNEFIALLTKVAESNCPA